MKILKAFFSKNKSIGKEEEKELARSGSVKQRMSLACNSKTSRAILYYLAEHDPEPTIRRAVAENKAMPVHVSPVLAIDKNEDVRLALAARLVALLPQISEDKQSQLYAFVVQALGTLALDEVLAVRKALSSTLKDHAYTPPKIAGQLARDVEREVSEPILRFCAAISDEDLIDILQDHPDGWVVEAIAGRDHVSEDVSEAVIETNDIPGGQVLIGNENAVMRESLLHYIVQKTRSFPEWQKPMAMRKTLPVAVAKALVEIADESVRDILCERDDFDEEATEEISAAFKRRLAYAHEGKSVDERLSDVLVERRLNEETLSDALAMRDRDFVYALVAEMANISARRAQEILEMNTAKPVVALSWKAGLSMRMALQLQKEIAHVQPKDILYPKGGADYPLSQDDLNWQLEFLGVRLG